MSRQGRAGVQKSVDEVDKLIRGWDSSSMADSPISTGAPKPTPTVAPEAPPVPAQAADEMPLPGPHLTAEPTPVAPQTPEAQVPAAKLSFWKAVVAKIPLLGRFFK
mgnify:CR=1 FL=1